MVGKREQTEILNFFPVLTCLSAGLRSLRHFWNIPPKLGLLNFHDLTSSWLVFWHLYLITSRHQLPKGYVVPCPSYWGETSASACCAHGHKVSNPRFFLVIFNYHKCLDLAIWRLSALFIYSFNLLWATLLSHTHTHTHIYIFKNIYICVCVCGS